MQAFATFVEPTRFYQDYLSDRVTNNASQVENPTLDCFGEYANGTAFDGTTDLSGTLGGGSAFGPTGTGGGGGTASTIWATRRSRNSWKSCYISERDSENRPRTLTVETAREHANL